MRLPPLQYGWRVYGVCKLPRRNEKLFLLISYVPKGVPDRESLEGRSIGGRKVGLGRTKTGNIDGVRT